MNKFYIFWSDGINSGFVDYSDDFVTDNLEEKALFFESEESAKSYINEIEKNNPFCNLSVAKL